MADDVPGPRPDDPDEPTREHQALPGDPDFDPTLAPPSDPYVDDTEVSMAAHDPTYDPTGEWDPSAGGYTAPDAGIWSGRAGVPEPGTRPAAPGDSDWVPEEEPRRAWYLPVIFGVVLLLLLGVLGLGLWLTLRDNGKQPTTPPSTAPVTTSRASSPTPAPSPSPTAPASSAPATVALPDLGGVQYDSAAALLKGKGLVPQRVDTVNSSLPAGTVINTDPAGPADVPAGSTVRLFVAVPPAPTSAAPSPTDSPTG